MLRPDWVEDFVRAGVAPAWTEGGLDATGKALAFSSALAYRRLNQAVTKNTKQAYSMKKTLALGLSLAGMLLFAGNSFAEEKVTKITGDGKCAKCAMKETDACQNAIQVEEKGKKVTYYLEQNKVSKDFHSHLCGKTQKVTAKGTVKEVDGKKQFTATEIELVKN
jgi:hypothetical protein